LKPTDGEVLATEGNGDFGGGLAWVGVQDGLDADVEELNGNGDGAQNAAENINGSARRSKDDGNAWIDGRLALIHGHVYGHVDAVDEHPVGQVLAVPRLRNGVLGRGAGVFAAVAATKRHFGIAVGVALGMAQREAEF